MLDVLDDDGLDTLDTDESVAQQVRAMDSFSFEQRYVWLTRGEASTDTRAHLRELVWIPIPIVLCPI